MSIEQFNAFKFNIVYKLYYRKTYNQQLILIKTMRKSIQWSDKEDEIILSNFTLIKSKKWKTISHLLKEQGYQKKQTQCRQRYINHLTPSLDKNKQISTEQLDVFYQKYQEYGPKWTLIQRFMPQKSQVQLKNIFYGNIRCFVKKIIKYFTNKTAVFVNKLDTFILQNLYSGKRNFKGLTFLKEDIKKMHYRFDEDLCFSLIEAREENYMNLFKVLLDQDEAKKSKHYKYFRKMNNRENITEDDIINDVSNSKEKYKQNQAGILNLQQVEKENNQINQISFQQQIINQFKVPYCHPQGSNWNQNQNFYLNQQVFRNSPNYLQIPFYESNANFYYNQYVSYQILNSSYNNENKYFSMNL